MRHAFKERPSIPRARAHSPRSALPRPMASKHSRASFSSLTSEERAQLAVLENDPRLVRITTDATPGQAEVLKNDTHGGMTAYRKPRGAPPCDWVNADVVISPEQIIAARRETGVWATPSTVMYHEVFGHIIAGNFGTAGEPRARALSDAYTRRVFGGRRQ
jgi:hypothetical protein